MLRLALILLMVAVVATMLGASGAVGAAIGFTKLVLFVAVLLFALSLVWGRTPRRRQPPAA